MTAKTQRQLLALAVLVAAAAAVWQLRGGDEPAAGTPPPSNPASGSAAQRPAPAQPPVADVKLELLGGMPDAAPEVDRNPFRFEPKGPPPAPPRPAGPPRPAVQPEPQVPQGPPPPPPIPLRLIGLLTAPTQAGRIAVLSDGRGNVFNGREGDIIEGRYRLLKIGADSVELAYVDGRGRQLVRLSGQ